MIVLAWDLCVAVTYSRQAFYHLGIKHHLDIPVVGQMQIGVMPFCFCNVHDLCEEGNCCKHTSESDSCHSRVSLALHVCTLIPTQGTS